MSIEQIQNIIISLFVAFSGTLIGGMVIRLALRKLFSLLTGQLNQAVEENKISAATKDKAVEFLNQTQSRIENKIDVLTQNTQVKDDRVIKLIDYYEQREAKIVEFMQNYFPDLYEELSESEE